MKKYTALVMIFLFAILLLVSACTQELDDEEQAVETEYEEIEVDEADEEQVVEDEYEVIEVDEADEEQAVETEYEEEQEEFVDENIDDEQEHESEEESREPTVELEVVVYNDKVVFSAHFDQGIITSGYNWLSDNINFSSWELYYRIHRTQDWERISEWGPCWPPSCDCPKDDCPKRSCHGPSPPGCLFVNDTYKREWTRQHTVRRENYNDWDVCYERISARRGEYKIRFLYKTDPCPIGVYDWWMDKEVFKDNIKTVEKVFTIN